MISAITVKTQTKRTWFCNLRTVVQRHSLPFAGTQPPVARASKERARIKICQLRRTPSKSWRLACIHRTLATSDDLETAMYLFFVLSLIVVQSFIALLAFVSIRAFIGSVAEKVVRLTPMF